MVRPFWFFRSWTVWSAMLAIALCYIPVVREIIHHAEIDLIQFQAILHIVLRFKTEERSVKLSAENLFKEEGNGP